MFVWEVLRLLTRVAQYLLAWMSEAVTKTCDSRAIPSHNSRQDRRKNDRGDDFGHHWWRFELFKFFKKSWICAHCDGNRAASSFAGNKSALHYIFFCGPNLFLFCGPFMLCVTCWVQNMWRQFSARRASFSPFSPVRTPPRHPSSPPSPPRRAGATPRSPPTIPRPSDPR